MLRTTIITLAAVALALPVAAQTITTIPLTLYAALPLDGPHYDIALGSTVSLEVEAPGSGDLYVFVALVDVDGVADPASALLLWAQPLGLSQVTSLAISIPLGLPDVTVGVQALFIEGGGGLYGSALHRLHLNPMID